MYELLKRRRQPWINENFPTSFLFILPPGCICWNITATSMHVTFTKRGYYLNFGDFSWNCFVSLHKKGMLLKFGGFSWNCFVHLHKKGTLLKFGDFSWNCFVHLHKKGMLLKFWVFQLELLCFDLLSIDDVDVLQPTGELYSRNALTPSACQNYM